MEEGFTQVRDTLLLGRIYGGRDKHPLRENLYDSYEIWLSTSQAPKEERVREDYASPAKCRMSILQRIDKEIHRLNCYGKPRTPIETVRTQLEMVRHSTPDAPALDRLLRCEASLERSFDRTPSQLARQQRMHRGLLVPPPLKVELSG